MKCRRVKKLLPLYVEGDLAPDVAERISAHLDWCGQCNWLADEFNESQSWLLTNEPPEFDQAFLDDFKSEVMSGLEQTTARPSLLAAIAQYWSRRQVLAMSGAILIVIGMVVFYIYQARFGVNPKAIETARQVPEPEAPIIEQPKAEVVPSPNHQSAPIKHARRHPIQKTERAKAMDNLRGPALFFQANRPVELGNPSEMAVKSEDPKDDVPEMLRIEIQTADPNIRIIWFTPRIADGPQTNQ
jgi:hypothetical protein